MTHQEEPRCPSCGHALPRSLKDHDELKCRLCGRAYCVLVDPSSGTTALIAKRLQTKAIEPLFLPRGSIRAAVALTISATAWVMVSQEGGLPEYLFGLLLTVLVYYFGFGSNQLSDRVYDPRRQRERPLGLPPGSIRVILIAGFLVAGTHLATANWDRLVQVRYLELFLIVLGLVAGQTYNSLIRHASSGARGIARHVKAVVVLLASGALSVLLLGGIHAQVPPPAMVALCAVISFYFASR